MELGNKNEEKIHKRSINETNSSDYNEEGEDIDDSIVLPRRRNATDDLNQYSQDLLS